MKTPSLALAAGAVLILAGAAQAGPRSDGNAAGASTRPAPTKEEVVRAEECRPKMMLEVLPYGNWAPTGGDGPEKLRVSVVREREHPQMQELILTNTDILQRGRIPTEWTVAKVDGNQTRAIVDLLLAEGFFARARRNPAPGGPEALCCVLSVTGESVHYVENLGWGPPMLARLDALRAVLEKGSPAAAAMDQWMARFEPFRQWEKAAARAAQPLLAEAEWREAILSAKTLEELVCLAMKRPSFARGGSSIPPAAFQEPNALGPRWRLDPRYAYESKGTWTFGYVAKDSDPQPGEGDLDVMLEVFRTPAEARQNLLDYLFECQYIILPGLKAPLASPDSPGDLCIESGRFVRGNVLVRFVRLRGEGQERAAEIDKALIRLMDAAITRASVPSTRPSPEEAGTSSTGPIPATRNGRACTTRRSICPRQWGSWRRPRTWARRRKWPPGRSSASSSTTGWSPTPAVAGESPATTWTAAWP